MSRPSNQTPAKTATTLISVEFAQWYDDSSVEELDARKGSRPLLIVMKVTNQGRAPIHIANPGNLSVAVVTESESKEHLSKLKGIAVKGEFLFNGAPKGVELKTKGELAMTWVSLGRGSDANLGTHIFLPTGAFDLAIQPGRSFELPAFFIVPIKYTSLTLGATGAERVNISIRK